MKRIVEPELLDELPPNDPRAVRSRGDLRRLNRLMRHTAIIRAAAMAGAARVPRYIVDIGAGDGSLMLALAGEARACWPGVRLSLVDRQRTVADATLGRFGELGWPAEVVTADVFDWLTTADHADAIIANLFLHHFSDERLVNMLRLIATRTDLFIACETQRTLPSLIASRWLGLIGCNAVTRHDAVISVRAGFAGRELSALWPAGDGWRLEEKDTITFTHVFVSRRNA